MKKKRRRRLKKQISVGIIAACLLAAGALSLLLTPVFNVKSVTVTGNKTISSQDIISGSGIVLGSNIFNISLRAVRDNVSSISGISSVKVKRRLPSVISINVKEGSAVVYIDNDGDYVGLAADGRVIEIIKAASVKAETKPVAENESEDKTDNETDNETDTESDDESNADSDADASETSSDDETSDGTVSDDEPSDDDGAADDESAMPQTQNVPVVTGMGKLSCKVGSKPNYSDEKKAENLSLLLDEFLSDEICRDFTSIDMSYYDDVTLVYKSNLTVRLGSVTDLGYKLKCFKTIIEQQLDENAEGTLDLERLTYSPKKK